MMTVQPSFCLVFRLLVEAGVTYVSVFHAFNKLGVKGIGCNFVSLVEFYFFVSIEY